jgi:TPR repeat protein
MRIRVLATTTLFLLTMPVFADPAADEAAKLCDQSAAAIDDKTNPAGIKGVASADFGEPEATTALAPCEAAHKAFADQPRYTFQYGRALRAKGGNDEASFALLLKAASAGHAVAMNHVGFSYDKGTGVAQDMAKAAEWYGKSAELGVANAQRNLGIYYRDALGVARDPAKAIHWFEKAAAQGLDDAWVEWGLIYDSGIGVPQDFNKAAELFLKAAAAGNVHGLNNMGLLHELGQGVAKDEAKARDYYEQAVAKDFESAMVNLGRMHDAGMGGLPVDHAKAIALYEKAVEYGEAEGNANLSQNYLKGEGVPKDVARGLKLLQQSVDDGSYYGAYLLAQEHLTGANMPRDAAKAADHFVLALERGAEEAEMVFVTNKGSDIPGDVVDLMQDNLIKRGATFKKSPGSFSPDAISYMQKLYSGNL